jgi:hypothetical protein
MVYEENYTQFLTATIHEWQPLLKDDKVKDIVTNSLRFLVKKTEYRYIVL